MSSVVPSITFNNGLKIPIFGLGTWKSKPGQVTQAVKSAIDIGYRHIDGAHIYGNEVEVGVALKAKIEEGVVKREDMFITSKLWNTFHCPDSVEKALKITLSHLELSYIDLYLIHWPTGWQEGGKLFPSSIHKKIVFSDIDYVDTWKGMEKMVQLNLTKSIGLSNFNKRQIDRILAMASVKPVNNQIECHPYLNQKKLIKFCKSHSIDVTAYSPLGSPDRPWAKPNEPTLLEEPKLKELTKNHNKTVAQVLLRYQVQRGLIVIPKSVTTSRIEENFKIFDFQLDQNDMDIIDGLDRNIRYCPLPESFGHPYHPFEKDEF